MGTATEKACAEITRLGAAAVTFDEAQRTKASSDWSRMSPILAEKVPPGRFVADAVVRPGSAADVATVLRVAYEHDVPVTPRGAGTGNYGQATPFEGGILLDLRRLTDVR
ncbi:MAG TPA: FAD-binding protein, partial [Pseudonocardia sp.]|nr:FAD-binding protein [Pseudonocardia sp.]